MWRRCYNANNCTRMKESTIFSRTGDNTTHTSTILDVVLSLVDEKGDPSAGQLSIRIMQESASVVAGHAVEQAQTSAQGLVQPLVTNVADTVTNISDAWKNQQNLITSFSALMQKLGVLVEIGDAVAKV